MCHNVDTVAVEARRCQFRQMVRAPCAPMSRGCTGEKGIVVHIFLQIAVARLSKPRFAPFSFSRRNAFHRPNVCPMTTRHTPFSSADIMDCIAATRVLHRSRISIRGKTLGSIRKHVDEHILEN